MTKVIVRVAASAALFGCGGTQDASDNTDWVYRTVVQFQTDGQPIVATSRITVAQQRAEVEARQRMTERGDSRDGAIGVSTAGIAADPSCMPQSLWVYDHPNQTGNEICFSGRGEESLYSFVRSVFCDRYHCYQARWDHAVRSYWAGVSDGSFGGYDPSGTWYPWHFAPYERLDITNLWVEDATVVDLRF